MNRKKHQINKYDKYDFFNLRSEGQLNLWIGNK